MSHTLSINGFAVTSGVVHRFTIVDGSTVDGAVARTGSNVVRIRTTDGGYKDLGQCSITNIEPVQRQVCRKCTSSCVPAVTIELDGNRRLHWCDNCADDAKRYQDQGSSVVDVERVAFALMDAMGGPIKAAAVTRETVLSLLRGGASISDRNVIALERAAIRLDELAEIMVSGGEITYRG